MIYSLCMEIIFINEAKDPMMYRFKKDYQAILEKACEVLHRPGDWSLSVIYVTPERIHEINRDYRNIDRATDVISFALQDDLDDAYTQEDQYELGDIFINVDAIRSQAKEYGHSIRREACFLFCHGLLHLMGYDHMVEDEKKEMRALEEKILSKIGVSEVNG